MNDTVTADSSIYRSDRMAAAYAFTRPPVHQHITARIARALARPVAAALDIGCGAGLSTAALAPLARRTVGVEPHAAMLRYAPAVAPAARFLVGRAEALPFKEAAFDLVTAAGALNYADLTLALAEIARVMTGRALFVPYDFSAGRRSRGDDRLERWYADFRRRYSSPPGYALDLRTLAYGAAGLELVEYEEQAVEIAMPLGQYVDYVMGESGVEHAIAAGLAESDIRRYCENSLHTIFSGGPQPVIFDTQVAYVGQ